MSIYCLTDKKKFGKKNCKNYRSKFKSLNSYNLFYCTVWSYNSQSGHFTENRQNIFFKYLLTTILHYYKISHNIMSYQNPFCCLHIHSGAEIITM